MEPVMYVLIRDDLPNHYASVQAGHAVAEYLKHEKNTKWQNGTLIYLSVRDYNEMVEWCEKLNSKQIPNYLFFDPDINEFTAMSCVVTDRKIFRSLKLKV